ncbi:translation initiation factor IF-3 [Alkalicella caledoniensis]|uniref:Translation initiation factor IF-3 n=1 Tax=Alkalicella caledoniensis TaxID=2731377 RepID=A0A7G9WDE5_ALKCA|nr:translation initiation factor IF-3 [Alkalicella caledoniensis]
MNEEIKVKEIRLIDEEGNQVGVTATKEALKTAQAKNLDLVEIAPQAKPPVCRIMDYGKYKYEQSKREKEARKNQHVITVKEIQVRPKIDEHDYQTKLRNIIKFLEGKDKVKVTIRFRGREVAYANQGKEICERIAETTKEIAVVEKPAKLEGRNMIMVLAPK